MLKAIIAGTVVMVSLPIGAANAQGEPNYKWEAGFQVTTIQFGAPAEKPLGLGGRIGRELGNHITVEAEANHFPENPSGNFGETQVVGGARRMYNTDQICILLKPPAMRIGNRR